MFTLKNELQARNTSNFSQLFSASLVSVCIQVAIFHANYGQLQQSVSEQKNYMQVFGAATSFSDSCKPFVNLVGQNIFVEKEAARRWPTSRSL